MNIENFEAKSLGFLGAAHLCAVHLCHVMPASPADKRHLTYAALMLAQSLRR